MCSPEPSGYPLRVPGALFLPLFPCTHPEPSGDGKNNSDASLQPPRASRGRRRASKLHVPQLGHVGPGKGLGFESWVKRSRAQQNGVALRGPCEVRRVANGGKPGWDFASKRNWCMPLSVSKILGCSERDGEKPNTPRSHLTAHTLGAV